ncbi:GMC oxidoreductase, partial [Mesorhizobium sp.]|uniref:GMC oxidoreductase n=1 Tax=Mesorhizobium sp. TaxID=1871066 RepID=UPI000FEA8F10
LQDHPLAQACVFRAKRPLGPVTGNGGGSMVNWKSRPDLPQADLHAFPVQGNSAEPAIRARYEISGDVFSFGAGVMRSKSVGHLRLLEARPGGALEIQPNFLAESEDLEAMVTAVEAVIEMAAARANAHVFAGFAAPDRRLSRKETVAFVRDACSTFFHTCGTCRMGEDEETVVDSRLAVRGIGGLTVADASVIPIIPSCNTHAPATMIGERAADFILQAA